MIRISLNENNITKLTVIAPIFTLILFTIMIITYFIEQTNTRFEEEMKKVEKEYIEYQKELVKREVLRTINYIKYRIKNVCDKEPEIVKTETLDFIQTIRYGQKGYIFILDFDGKVVYNPFIKKDLDVSKSTDKNGKPFIQDIIEVGKNKDGGFVNYNSRSIDTSTRDNKISYVNNVKEWGWIVGGGVYLDEIGSIIEEKRSQMKHKQSQDIEKILIVSLIVLIVVSFFSIIITSAINKVFNTYKYKVESKKRKLEKFNAELGTIVNQKTSELQTLNKELANKVEDEVRKNREKDDILIMQSRLASMGEMISNIAHQWRQPLNKLGLLISNIQVDRALGGSNNEDKYFKSMEDTIKYMSHTIDDFRNFFITQDEPILFNAKDAIVQSISIVDVSMQHKNIELILNLETNCMINGIQTEFTQVIINILNNARDILIAKAIKNAFIKIDLFCENTNVIITIEDNGGGIDTSIIHKIFDPYFTTKHKNQGTGIGLYMSKNIIEKKMHGHLDVENKNDGACFIIQIPSQNL